MKKQNLKRAGLILIFITFSGFLFTGPGLADNERRERDYFEREDQHSIPFLETDNEGNETAGQIAAWLLLVANFPIVLSILIKGINRFAPLGDGLKKTLVNFNRFQKKYLMFVHYYLNLAILGVVAWHYVSSRCLSTSLPEWGLFLMICLIAFGILIKFKLCPKVFRKYVYQIHTQPAIFVAMILVLTTGHLIVD